MGDYIHSLRCLKYYNNYLTTDAGQIFYIAQTPAGLELTPVNGPYCAQLVENCEDSARLPGFGKVNVLTVVRDIAPGATKIGNTVIYSDEELKACLVGSVIDPNGREIIFGIDWYKDDIIIFKYEHLQPTSTKCALNNIHT